MLFKHILSTVNREKLKKAAAARRTRLGYQNPNTSSKSYHNKHALHQLYRTPDAAQRAYLNNPKRSRKTWLVPSSTIAHHSWDSKILSDVHLPNFQTRYRQRFFRRKRRKYAVYALLAHPHGYTPELPFPDSLEHSLTDFLIAGHKALDMKVTGHDIWWKQFWKAASRITDILPISELILLLQFKHQSNHRSIFFLKKVILDIVEDVHLLNLVEIGSIMQIYYYFNCFSTQLCNSLLQRATIYLLQFPRHCQDTTSYTQKTSLSLYQPKNNQKDFDQELLNPNTIADILEPYYTQLHRVTHNIQEQDSTILYNILRAGIIVLTECQLTPQFISLSRACKSIQQFYTYLTPIDLHKLTIRAQLFTVAFAQHPTEALHTSFTNFHQWETIFNQNILRNDNLKTIIQHPIQNICDFCQFTINQSIQSRIEFQSDVRHILMFHLATIVQNKLADFQDLSVESVYLRDKLYCHSSILKHISPNTFICNYHRLQTHPYNLIQDTLHLKNATHIVPGTISEFIIEKIQPYTKKKKKMGEKKKQKLLDMKNKQISIKQQNATHKRNNKSQNLRQSHAFKRQNKHYPLTTTTPTMIPKKFTRDEEHVLLETEETIDKNNTALNIDAHTVTMNKHSDKRNGPNTKKNEYSKKPIHCLQKKNLVTQSNDLDFVNCYTNQYPQRTELFQKVVQPSVQTVIHLWQQLVLEQLNLTVHELTPSLSITPTVTSDNDLQGNRRIYCNYNDHTLYAKSFRYFHLIKPTTFELFIIICSMQYTLKLGALSLTPNGLCSLIDATTFIILFRASEHDTLNWDIPRNKKFVPAIGLHLTNDDKLLLEVLSYESARKWGGFSYEQKYRVALAMAIIGFRNHYLNCCIRKDWHFITSSRNHTKYYRKEHHVTSGLEAIDQPQQKCIHAV